MLPKSKPGCPHEWTVRGAIPGRRVLLCCQKCGAWARVNKVSAVEWGEAQYAKVKPYKWQGSERRIVLLTRGQDDDD